MINMAVKGIIDAGGVIWTVHQRRMCLEHARRENRLCHTLSFRHRPFGGQHIPGRMVYPLSEGPGMPPNWDHAFHRISHADLQP